MVQDFYDIQYTLTSDQIEQTECPRGCQWPCVSPYPSLIMKLTPSPYNRDGGRGLQRERCQRHRLLQVRIYQGPTILAQCHNHGNKSVYNVNE